VLLQQWDAQDGILMDHSSQHLCLLSLSPGFYTPEMGIETREIHRMTAYGS